MRAVDLFAGCGGSTKGAELAGVEVVAGINHWLLAVQSYRLNHPRALVIHQDIQLVNAVALKQERPFDLVLASPACQGHSPARGEDLPHHDESRLTGNAVIDFIEKTLPRAFIVENVPEFLKWALWPNWLASVRYLGYQPTINILNARDFGVPQERVRLFVTAVRGKQISPVPVPRCRAVPASSILEAAPMNPIDRPGRAKATLARIAAGRARFGSRFLIPYYGSGSGETGRSLDRPIGTITTRARWALIDGDRMRMVSIPEVKRAMTFPASYRLLGTIADQHKQLGNAVPPELMRAVVRHVAEAA